MSFSVGSLRDLSKAPWATVRRGEYMRIVRARRQQCATFAHVELREAAATRLPAEGMPERVWCCLLMAAGADAASV